MGYYIQNSLLGLAIISVIFFNLYKQNGRFQVDQRIYISILVANALLLTLELLLNITTGAASELARTVLPAIVILFYILNPVPEALWLLYLGSIINKKKVPSMKLVIFISLPVILNGIFSLINLFWSFTFYIDERNIYHRGKYFFLMPLICYSYLILYIILALKKRKQILKHEFQSLFIAVLPPIVAGLLQTAFFGLSLVWVALSFSMLIIYIRMQSVQIYTDHLTGLANRRKFDLHLDAIFSSDQRRKQFGGIFIDVDDFKQVNDLYGHDLGDRAIEEIGNVLRRSVRKKDLVARIGGDEFAIIVEASETDLEEVVYRIYENVDRFNERSNYPFHLSLSLGYDHYAYKTDMDKIEFLKHIDNKMYKAKRYKKHLDDAVSATAAQDS